MRLNRFLATAGLGSRRGVEELIEKGRVKVNGTVVTDLATTVKPTDVIKVGSKVVRPEHTIYAVMNKPTGYICSADDEQDRRTVYELLPDHWPRVFHVGRLDMESQGLLMMTNDGDLSLALTHPKYKVAKEYEVVLDKPFDPAHSEKLLRGFHIIGGRAKMESIQLISGRRLRLVLTQGIKRQIRLMMYEMGYEVEQLKRLRIGSVELGNLPLGHSRLLTPAEVDSLRLATSPAATTKEPAARTAPGFRDLRPADRRGKGPVQRETPAAKDKRPAPRGERPASRGDRPDFRNERSAPRGGRPPAREGRPASAGARPERPSRPGERDERRFAKPADRREASSERPWKRDDRPANRPERPYSRPERGAPRSERPAPRPERGAPRGERPAPRAGRPASGGGRPAPRPQRPGGRGPAKSGGPRRGPRDR